MTALAPASESPGDAIAIHDLPTDVILLTDRTEAVEQFEASTLTEDILGSIPATSAEGGLSVRLAGSKFEDAH